MSKKTKKSKSRRSSFSLGPAGRPNKKIMLIVIVLTAIVGTIALHNSFAASKFLITAYSVESVPSGSCKYWGGHTATPTRSGRCAKVGRTVAVDPKVIRPGSRVCIEGVGTRIAEDTGRLIKGRHIDLFVHDDHFAFQWGTKHRIVTRGSCTHHVPFSTAGS
jgi:3D (Asp-Asp-Asp) domain-containing protein